MPRPTFSKRRSRRLEQVNQAILARAFRGELVPQDPDDEPASALLEKIEQKHNQAVQPKLL